MLELDAATLGALDETVMLRAVVGRRKSATVRVYFRKGNGNMRVNGRDFKDYFKLQRYFNAAHRPLTLACEADNRFANVDVFCTAKGGGTTGQVEAMRLAISRKIVELSAAMRPDMRGAGLLTCDSRKVESKKYGRRKARRRFQYAKR